MWLQYCFSVFCSRKFWQYSSIKSEFKLQGQLVVNLSSGRVSHNLPHAAPTSLLISCSHSLTFTEVLGRSFALADIRWGRYKKTRVLEFCSFMVFSQLLGVPSFLLIHKTTSWQVKALGLMTKPEEMSGTSREPREVFLLQM